MGDFEDKLDSILNNPQAMSQIMNLAQSLSGSGQNHSDPTPSEPSSSSSPGSDFPLDPRLLNSMVSVFSQYNQSDDQRVALLNALRPFVKERRYEKIDKAIQVVKISRIARIALDFFRTKEDPDV